MREEAFYSYNWLNARNSPKFLFSFFFKIYLFLLERQIYERRRDREEDLPSDGSIPKWLQQLELSQSEARSQELLSSGSPMWVQGPKALGRP